LATPQRGGASSSGYIHERRKLTIRRLQNGIEKAAEIALCGRRAQNRLVKEKSPAPVLQSVVQIAKASESSNRFRLRNKRVVTNLTQRIKKAADRHWEDANASISPVASPHCYTKGKESKNSARKYPSTAEVWHCRHDAVGSLLRSFDLSPRRNF
jgi:hypothetical protein